MRFPSLLASRRLASIVAAFVFVSPVVQNQYPSAPENHGIIVTSMDPSVRPGDDFFRYANGAWIKRTEIPSDTGYVAIGGWQKEDQSTDQSRRRIATLIDEVVKAKPPIGSNARRIADLYASYMDETTIEARGLAPLRPHLDSITSIRDKHELSRALGETLRADVDPLNWSFYHTSNLFGLWVAPGFNDPEHYAGYLLQGGLELPDREYYLADSENMRDIRAKYNAHVSAMLRLGGFTDSESRASRIIKLEHAIAEKHIPFADEQNIEKANNTWKQTDFPTKAPGLDWQEFFRGAGISRQESFTVWQPAAFVGESSLVASVSLETWKDWLAFHLIESYAAVLPKALADERFAFFAGTLNGAAKQASRRQRAYSVIDSPLDESGNAFAEGRGVLGEVVGRKYVERFFSPEARGQIEALVANIIAAYRRRIDALSWMDPATKAEAQAKLKSLYVGVGYPEKWQDYSGYDVKPDDLFGNLWRGGLFAYHDAAAHLGQPVDRKAWCMYTFPQIVNAVELPLQNAINLPAALLEPPFFDEEAPAASNYGSLGGFIGHEISHTFDIEGSAVDSAGRVRNWWKPADRAHFEEATARLVAQYDRYRPFADLALNGKQTLDENIADLGGVSAAYDAYHASLGSKAAPVIDHFTEDQQFFLAWAQSNASKSSDAVLRQQVMSDVHSPDEYRSVTVRNLAAWYLAFEIKPGDKLYLAPPDRIRIW